MHTKSRKDSWVFWLRIKWIYNETAFTKGSLWFFTECYFLEVFDSVAHILESGEQKRNDFHLFPAKTFPWCLSSVFGNTLIGCTYIQLPILKLEFCTPAALNLSYPHGVEQQPWITGMKTKTLNVILVLVFFFSFFLDIAQYMQLIR